MTRELTTPQFTTRTFIDKVKQRFERFFSSSSVARFTENHGGEPASSSLHGERDDKLLTYERYHWGSGSGPWY